MSDENQLRKSIKTVMSTCLAAMLQSQQCRNFQMFYKVLRFTQFLTFLLLDVGSSEAKCNNDSDKTSVCYQQGNCPRWH